MIVYLYLLMAINAFKLFFNLFFYQSVKYSYHQLFYCLFIILLKIKNYKFNLYLAMIKFIKVL